MVTRTFCDVCGKEIIEEGTKEKSVFIGRIELKEFSSIEDFESERVWDSHTLHLCPADLKKTKEIFHLE